MLKKIVMKIWSYETLTMENLLLVAYVFNV